MPLYLTYTNVTHSVLKGYVHYFDVNPLGRNEILGRNLVCNFLFFSDNGEFLVCMKTSFLVNLGNFEL